jgi:mono/diheme cytochrome c family protein
VPRRTFIDFSERGLPPITCPTALAALSHFTGDHMRHITFYIFITITCAALPTPTQSLEDTHRSVGRRVAMEICSHCHRVAEGQRAPLPNTPSFIDIANMPSTTAVSLKVFLRSKHKRRMPNFIMSNADTDGVVDYILSLKQR